MSHYSGVERKTAAYLSRFPYLKSILKRGYQCFNYLFYKPSYKVKTEFDVKRSSPNIDGATFFGYYDKCPVSADGKCVLMHAFSGDTARRPTSNEQVDIIVADRITGNPVQILSSSAFNWQQGSRLQWIDNDRYAYNDIADDNTHYVTRVASVKDKAIKSSYDMPIQDGWRGEYFLSLSYRRLRALRPDYGYFSLPPLFEKELQKLDDDGLWHVSYKTGNCNLIYTLEKVCSLRHKPAFENAVHYLNHAMIAPDGDRFVFLHRYVINGQRFDRLLLGDPEGEDLRLLADHDMVSHYCWVNDHTLVGYMRGPAGHDGYYLIDVKTGNMTRAFEGKLDKYGDGHPHVQGTQLVTDTYPNKGRIQKLIMCDLKSGSIQEIAALHHGLQYDAEARCDLHPRLSPDGETVSFDSVFDGTRELYELSLLKAHER